MFRRFQTYCKKFYTLFKVVPSEYRLTLLSHFLFAPHVIDEMYDEEMAFRRMLKFRPPINEE